MTTQRRVESSLYRPLFCIVLLSALISVPAHAQQLAQPTVTITPATAAPGQAVTLTVSIPLTTGQHIYGPNVQSPYYATHIKITQPGPVTWRTPQFQKTTLFDAFDPPAQVIDPDPATGMAMIIVPGTVNQNAPTGTHTLTITLTYQVCTATQCYRPVIDRPLQLVLTVGDRLASTSPTTAPRVDQPPTPPQGYGANVRIFSNNIDLQKLHLPVTLLVAFLAGLALNLMPCVLPIIPIKLSLLAREAEQKQRPLILVSLFFCIGIVGFFLTIAVLAIALKGTITWGEQFQTPGFLIATATVIVALALGMFELFYIQPPAFLAGRSANAASYTGATMMGVLAGVLATPCSFGLLGAAVAWAQGQRPALTLLAFATIGLGMACPYLILASQPALVRRIPTTGMWSLRFKQAMGFLLLGVAAFLVAALPHERVFDALMFLILVAFVLWIWGTAWQGRTGWRAHIARVAAVAVLVLGGYGLLGTADGATLKWQDLSDEVIRQAQATGRPYVVKFTAEWCGACRTVDRRIFGNQSVQEAIEANGVTVIRADLTRDNAYGEAKLKEWTGQAGPPFTVVFRPGKQRVLLPGVYRVDELLAAIQTED